MAVLNSNKLNGKSRSSPDATLLSVVPGFCARVYRYTALLLKFYELWIFTNVLAINSAFSTLLIAFMLLLCSTGILKLLFMPFIFLVIPHTCDSCVSLPVLLQYCLQYVHFAN